MITSSDELEGSADKPGIFLRVLRNQCLARKRGSVVLMDEADWLNQENMISAAKRVFNGELAHLSTTYFGSGIDGTGIHLEMPPMLIILLSNNSIKNDALESRFDAFYFPLPKKKVLETRGKKLFKDETKNLFEDENENLIGFDSTRIKQCINFREVESMTSALIGQKQFLRVRKKNDLKENDD